MIFDEIDRGVGGAVASAIGERLARLAKQSQVWSLPIRRKRRAAHHFPDREDPWGGRNPDHRPAPRRR